MLALKTPNMSVSHWRCGNFKLECCYIAFLMRMQVKPIAKNWIHFVKVRPSILCQQLSNMENDVFWNVTPCSLIDNCTWFRENLTPNWAAHSTGKSTHISYVFRSEYEISEHTVWLLMDPFDYLTTVFKPQNLQRQMIRKMFTFT